MTFIGCNQFKWRNNSALSSFTVHNVNQVLILKHLIQVILELWFHYWTYFKRLEQLFTINLRFNWDLLILRWLILALCFRKMQNMMSKRSSDLFSLEFKPFETDFDEIWRGRTFPKIQCIIYTMTHIPKIHVHQILIEHYVLYRIYIIWEALTATIAVDLCECKPKYAICLCGFALYSFYLPKVK